MKNILKYVLAELAFILLSLFGSAIPMLLNAFAPYYGRYREGDLGYKVLQLISNGIGVTIAVYALDYLTSKEHPLLCLVNCVIGAVMFITLAIFEVLYVPGGLFYAASIFIGGCAFVFHAISFGKQIKEFTSCK